MRKWIPIEAAGEFSHSSGVVQVIDDKSFNSILAQDIPPDGLLLDFDHYSSLTDEERGVLKRLGIQLPSNAAGWIKKLARKTVDGIDKIFGLVDFTPAGEAAIRGKEYVWTSPVHPRAALENLGNGKARALAISKVALTNAPNIKAIGSVLNRRGLLDLENSNPDEKWITINGRPVRIDENGEPDFDGGPAGWKSETSENPIKRPIVEWKPDQAKPHNDLAEARKRLQAGFKTKDVLGSEVEWDKGIIDHWEHPSNPKLAKSPEEVSLRLRILDRAVEATSSPHEVWQNDKGNFTYIHMVSDETGKSRVMHAFQYTRETKIGSYFESSNSRDWEQKRIGRLVYSRPIQRVTDHGAPRADASSSIADAGTALGNREHTTEPMVVKVLEIELPAEDVRDSVETEKRNLRKMMKEQIAKLLKLDPAAADDVIVEAIRALVGKEAAAQAEAQNRATQLAAKTTEAASLKNRAEAAETELGTMKTAQVKAETDAKVKAELAKYADLPNRAQAEDLLRADFAKGSAFLASLKLPGKVPGKTPDIENRMADEDNKPKGLARVIAALKK